MPGVLHHITQRGNRKHDVFFSNEDREFFLDRLAFYADRARLSIASYCLMTNHTHLLAIPKMEDSLWRAMKPLHMCYSQYLNKSLSQVGINWQGRFYSAPLDERHSWIAFQYVALNPVRAGITTSPELYPWSSAKLHLRSTAHPLLTADERWLTMAHRAMVDIAQDIPRDDQFQILRRNTKMNLPCGSEAFIQNLELENERNLHFRKRGRPSKQERDI